MSREWKPGDVAVRISALDYPEQRTMFTRDCLVGGHQIGDHWHHAEGGWDKRDGESTYRPLVVIDPEDREAVERLTNALDQFITSGDDYADGVQAALREFANPTPPKPDEPTGLGAVVEDSVGRVWVFADTTRSELRWHGEDGWRTWDELNPVRVLSEGVR